MPFDPYTIPLNNIISVDGVLWTNTGTAVGPIFPPVTLSFEGIVVGTYILTSDYPAMEAGRDLTLQGLGPFGWYDMWHGNEDDLPATINLLGLIFTEIRAKYTLSNGCEYLATGSTGGRGDIEVTVTPQTVCGTGTFLVNVNIVSLSDYAIGSIIPTVNGVAQTPISPTLGLNILGPYTNTAVVSIRITNLSDSECDYVSNDVIDQQLPQSDYSVFQAVDASFQTSANPGTAYLIVTNTDGVANIWSSHVGEIWTGTAFILPAEGEVTNATDALGPESFWQMMSGVQTQVFPSVLFLHNTITDVWTAYPNPIATFIAGTDILVQYECPSEDPQEIYSGPIEGFTETVFSPSCAASVIAGSITYYPDCPLPIPAVIEEYSFTGDPDPDFSEGGLNDLVQVMRIQDDGGILVGGFFTQYNGTTCNRFTRLLSDGSLDAAYNTALGTAFDQSVLTLSLDSDGKAVVGGTFLNFQGASQACIARLNTDGTLDTSFVIGTGFAGGTVRDLVIMDDGVIIIVGSFTSYNGTSANRIIALNPDGTVNTDWDFGTGFSNLAISIAKDSSGRILVWGGYFFYDGIIVRYLVRILPDGTLDPSFTTANGTLAGPSIVTLDDGRIISCGTITSYQGITVPNIICLNEDGTLDTAFMANLGAGSGSSYKHVEVLPNGDGLIFSGPNPGGAVGSPETWFLRVGLDGVIDTAFITTGRGPNAGGAVSRADTVNGGLVVGGAFTIFDNLPRLRVARLI